MATLEELQVRRPFMNELAVDDETLALALGTIKRRMQQILDDRAAIEDARGDEELQPDEDEEYSLNARAAILNMEWEDAYDTHEAASLGWGYDDAIERYADEERRRVASALVEA